MSTAAPSPAAPYRLRQILRHHNRAVSCAKFSDDGALFATASLDKTAIIYSTHNFEPLAVLTGHADGISDIAWSSSSLYLCSASDDCTVRIWDARAAAAAAPASDLLVKTLRGHSDPVFCVAFNFESTLLASGGLDHKVRIWEVKTGKCATIIAGHSSAVTSVHFIKDGSVLVSGSHDGSCRIWDASNGSCLKTVVEVGRPGVSFVKFAPNGRYVLVATLNDTLKLWDYQTGKSLKIYGGHKNKVYCIQSTFSVTNGKYIVSGSEDKSVILWDLQGKHILQKLEGHTDTVICVSCHPTENMIISAGLDGDRTARIWVQGNA